MAQTKTQKILRYSLWGLTGLGLLALLLYFFVIRTVQINHQKQNFSKAEASLDSLEKQIEAKIGKPDQIKKEKSCDRANLKSEKGPLGCDISISLQYKNKNANESNQIMSDTLSLGKGNIRLGSGAAHGNAFTQKNSSPGGVQIFYQDLPSFSNVTCTISYRYPYEMSPASEVSPESITLNLSCGGQAMQEYFPVKS